MNSRNTHTLTHKHTHIHTNTHTHTRARAHTHTQTQARKHSHTGARTGTRAHTHTHGLARTHTCEHTRTRGRAHTHTHTHTHTLMRTKHGRNVHVQHKRLRSWRCESVGRASDRHAADGGSISPVWQGIFLPVNFQCRFSYGVRTPPCAIACITSVRMLKIL